MKIGIMTVNDISFHPTLRLTQAANKRNCNTILINPYQMLSGIERGNFQYFIEDLSQIPDVVLPRQGSPMGGLWTGPSSSIHAPRHPPG